MKQKQIIAFNKRFANGEQNIELTSVGKIVSVEKEYYWQQNAVYNKIGPLVELFSNQYAQKFETQLEFDKAVYGKNGLVARLLPVQRAYNSIRNRKQEFLNRLVLGTIFVEDGSVDTDELAEEGLSPGKIIVYRQGSIAPILSTPSASISECLDKELCSLDNEFQEIYEDFRSLYD